MTFEKHELYTAISKRAEQLRGPNETVAQAFTRTITKDEMGVRMYAALKVAPGVEVKPIDAPTAGSGPKTRPGEPRPKGAGGSADEIMAEMARDAQRRNGKFSYEQAYASVFADPANRELRDRLRREHLAINGGHADGFESPFSADPIGDAIRETRPTIKGANAPADPEQDSGMSCATSRTRSKRTSKS
jgi:hypothetical protein